MLAAAAVVSAAVCVLLVIQGRDITTSLGDTDDAMRLSMVRDLLGGRGWYDQWIGRLQPPLGVYMHWSRLLDGALAAVTAALRVVLPPGQAEWAMRFFWPLAWVFPVTLAGLAVARNLGARSAAFICAVLLALDTSMFVQFRPGRIDHHNIQITMAVAACACALVQGETRARWAVMAGIASGLGLAIGVEALAFHALIGAAYGLRLAFDPADARTARAYGLSLAAASLGFFLVQTPPIHWLTPYCDALGSNLVSTLIISGLGLAAASLATKSASTRIALLALSGLAAASAYILSDPICLRGPFGAVDPRVRPFWFDHIQELEDWPALFRDDKAAAVHSIVIGVLGALAGLWLIIRGRKTPFRGDLLLAACAFVAVVAETKAYRMEDYGLWFGTPALAVALGDAAAWFAKDKMIPSALMAIALSPTTVGDAVILALLHGPPAPKTASADHCDDVAAFGPLGRLPRGVVLAEPDIGAEVMANTRDAALSAPYHRMTWGILAAHETLAAPSDKAEGEARALGATYIVDCPAHVLRTPPVSLNADLRSGHSPTWLIPRSKPGDALQIFQVAPASPQPRP